MQIRLEDCTSLLLRLLLRTARAGAHVALGTLYLVTSFVSPAEVAQQRAGEGCVVPGPFVRTRTLFAHIRGHSRGGGSDGAAGEMGPELFPLAHN